MHFGHREESVVEDVVADGRASSGHADHGDVKGKGIGHPALKTDETQAILEIALVCSSGEGGIVGKCDIGDGGACVFSGHQVGNGVDLP